MGVLGLLCLRGQDEQGKGVPPRLRLVPGSGPLWICRCSPAGGQAPIASEVLPLTVFDPTTKHLPNLHHGGPALTQDPALFLMQQPRQPVRRAPCNLGACCQHNARLGSQHPPTHRMKFVATRHTSEGVIIDGADRGNSKGVHLVLGTSPWWWQTCLQ